MSIQIVNENLVITAKSFNPSIFTQLWLVKQNIIPEAEFTENTIFTPVAVDIKTKKYNLLLLAERLQITFSRDATEKELILLQVPLAIVNKLPHTPYLAIGYNIRVVFTPENNDIYSRKAKELLLGAKNPLSDSFSEPDARFGFYCSKDLLGARLKLDLKPTYGKEKEGDKIEILNFDFNYQKDLMEEDKIPQIANFLSNWTKIETHCVEIMQIFEKKWKALS